MATSVPKFSQYRSNLMTYLFKQTGSDQLLIRIYTCTHKCIFKRHLKISELKAPETFEPIKSPEQAIVFLVKKEVIDAKLAPYSHQPIDLKKIQEMVQQAIDSVGSSVSKANSRVEQFTCPITLETFTDPVIDEHGHTFEKSAIEEHLRLRAHAGCPVNRRPIRSLTPNLVVKQAIEEFRQKNEPPKLTDCKESNQKLALQNAQLARAYVEEQQYEEAESSYKKMMQYTRDPGLFHEVIGLYEKMNEPEKAQLCLLDLVSFYLDAKNINEAFTSLEEAYMDSKPNMKIMDAISELIIYVRTIGEGFDCPDSILRCIMALSRSSRGYSEGHQEKLIAFFIRLFARFPIAWQAYILASNTVDNEAIADYFVLQGASHALQCQNYGAVGSLSMQIEENRPFVDRLIEVTAIELSPNADEVTNELQQLKDKYLSFGQIVDATKASKRLTYLHPSHDNFLETLRLYNQIKCKEKINRWYKKWLSHLIASDDWNEVIAATKRAEELSIDPFQINTPLSDICKRYRGRNVEPLYLGVGSEFAKHSLLDQAEEVYRVGYTHFKGFKICFELAEVLATQQKTEYAVQQYYSASIDALNEDSSSNFNKCVAKLRELDPWMDHLEDHQRVNILSKGELGKLQKRVRTLEQSLKAAEKRPPGDQVEASQSAKTSSTLVDRATQTMPVQADGTELPKGAFGKDEWFKYFGDVGEEPIIPKGIYDSLEMPCPFWPDKKVKNTHKLVLIPAKVNGTPFTLSSLGRLIEHPKAGGHACKYNTYSQDLKYEIGGDFPEGSYWVLMTREVISETIGKSYNDQLSVLDSIQGDQLSYDSPEALEAATVILTEYVATGQRLFSDEPMMHTRCKEEIGAGHASVGEFGPQGLNLGDHSCFLSSSGLAPARWD